MSKPKYIKDAIFWNCFAGDNGAWLRGRDLNLVTYNGEELYLYAFSGQNLFYIRDAYPYEPWMERYIGTCEDLKEDENFKKNK